jgi:hypothetical protein
VSSRNLSLLVVLLLLSGCLGDSDEGDNESTSNSGTSDTNSTGSSLPTTPSSETCLTAPVFEIETLNRTGIESPYTNNIGLFNLMDHRGKTIILDFTAADVSNGRVVHDGLKERLNHSFSSVLIVSIGVWNEPLDYLNGTFGQGDSELPWIVGAASEPLRESYAIIGIPHVYVIDYAGYLIHLMTGSPSLDNWTALEEAVDFSEKWNTGALRQEYRPSPPNPCYIPSPDNDEDGLSDYVDIDDDNDGWLDTEEAACQTDPFDSSSIPADFDDDNICDEVDYDNDNDGYSDSMETIECQIDGPSDPFDAESIPVDSDGDGLSDCWELNNGLNPYSNPTDTDGDGLPDTLEETQYGTDPMNWDTDGDGLGDGVEIENGTNPLDNGDYPEEEIEEENYCSDLDEDYPEPDKGPSGDPDGDGLTNLQESQLGTNCSESDTDGDLLGDGWEVLYSLNPLLTDSAEDDLDGDNLSNLQEYLNYTDPFSNDTDNDGLNDSFEISWIEAVNGSTSFDSDGDGFRDGPCDWDTDGDGMSDKYEMTYIDILNPIDPNDSYGDPDDDGLNNIEESLINTNPNNNDTDGDGMPDGWESANGLNATSVIAPNGADDDPDADGLTNLEEYNARDRNGDGIIDSGTTDPLTFDTDGDGLGDGIEVNGWNIAVSTGDGILQIHVTSDPGSWDTDADGLSDYNEFSNFTNASNPDTDGDGLSDYHELISGIYWDGIGEQGTYHTNASMFDSDDDGLGDGEEVMLGNDGYITNAVDSDTDDDGLEDGNETLYLPTPESEATDPNDPDSDDDGVDDGSDNHPNDSTRT